MFITGVTGCFCQGMKAYVPLLSKELWWPCAPGRSYQAREVWGKGLAPFCPTEGLHRANSPASKTSEPSCQLPSLSWEWLTAAKFHLKTGTHATDGKFSVHYTRVWVPYCALQTIHTKFLTFTSLTMSVEWVKCDQRPQTQHWARGFGVSWQPGISQRSWLGPAAWTSLHITSCRKSPAMCCFMEVVEIPSTMAKAFCWTEKLFSPDQIKVSEYFLFNHMLLWAFWPAL